MRAHRDASGETVSLLSGLQGTANGKALAAVHERWPHTSTGGERKCLSMHAVMRSFGRKKREPSSRSIPDEVETMDGFPVPTNDPLFPPNARKLPVPGVPELQVETCGKLITSHVLIGSVPPGCWPQSSGIHSIKRFTPANL